MASAIRHSQKVVNETDSVSVRNDKHRKSAVTHCQSRFGIHVSHWSNQDRQMVRMMPAGAGRLIPPVTSSEALLALG